MVAFLPFSLDPVHVSSLWKSCGKEYLGKDCVKEFWGLLAKISYEHLPKFHDLSKQTFFFLIFIYLFLAALGLHCGP